MKTIAVLTMFFLPGTFFAALFSMPSLGWDQDQPGKFVVYWACVVPVTVLTFALWAALTERQAVLRLVRRVRRRRGSGHKGMLLESQAIASGDVALLRKMDT